MLSGLQKFRRGGHSVWPSDNIARRLIEGSNVLQPPQQSFYFSHMWSRLSIGSSTIEQTLYKAENVANFPLAKVVALFSYALCFFVLMHFVLLSNKHYTKPKKVANIFLHVVLFSSRPMYHVSECHVCHLCLKLKQKLFVPNFLCLKFDFVFLEKSSFVLLPATSCIQRHPQQGEFVLGF